MDFNTTVAEVKSELSIEIDTRDVERVLSSVRNSVDLWKIVDQADVPIPAVFAIIRNLEQKGLIKITGIKIMLTRSGEDLCNELHPVEDMSCTACEGRGIVPDRFESLFEKFFDIQRSRPHASHDYDQGYVTASTSVARFVLAYERGDIKNRDILILGDDDLVSIVIGLSGLAKSITVVEIDKRLTDFIRRASKDEGFCIEVEDFDLRKPLPDAHVGNYDTFFTDPPETIRAADAFVGRGVASLKSPGCSGYFGFTRREASLRKWYDLQRLLVNYGVVTTDIIHNFSEYVNWGYEQETRAWELAPIKVMPGENWYRSSLYRIQALDGFRGSYIDYGTDNIYEDTESSTT